MNKSEMKFLVVLCLFALVVADEDTQEQSQSVDNTQTNKPTLASTPSTPTFGSQGFPTPTLNFGNKDTFSGVTFPGFTGSFPNFQTVTSDLFTTGTGVVNGAIPQFSQVTRTVVPTNTGLGGNLQTGFGVPNTVLTSIPSFGHQFTGLPATRVLTGLNTGYQGVPTGTPTFGVGYQLPTTSYRFVTQDGLTSFPQQGTPTVTGTTGVPVFTGGVLSPLTSGVYPGTQGVLKTPVTGTNVNVPNYTTGNTATEQTGTVFRRA